MADAGLSYVVGSVREVVWGAADDRGVEASAR